MSFRSGLIAGIFAGALVCGLSAVYAQQSARFDAGVLLGYDSRACGTAPNGTIRYNSATKVVQFCHNTTWNNWSG